MLQLPPAYDPGFLSWTLCNTNGMLASVESIICNQNLWQPLNRYEHSSPAKLFSNNSHNLPTGNDKTGSEEATPLLHDTLVDMRGVP